VGSPIFSETYQSQGPDHKLAHRCELTVNSVDWGLHHVDTSHYCNNGACHYVFRACHYVSVRATTFSVRVTTVSLRFPCLSLRFPCVSLRFPCVCVQLHKIWMGVTRRSATIRLSLNAF
jgi:hypothetical protein